MHHQISLYILLSLKHNPEEVTSIKLAEAKFISEEPVRLTTNTCKLVPKQLTQFRIKKKDNWKLIFGQN